MIKTFPKSRICVIDAYPSFEKGLKAATEFANKNNIKLNSADGKRVILGFCFKNIEAAYKNTQSSFPKVLCISKKAITQKISNFIDNYFDGMMSQLPIPYCGKFDLTSPDLESAAENSLKQQKPLRRFNEFSSKIKLKQTV
jgi:hypothetical protein